MSHLRNIIIGKIFSTVPRKVLVGSLLFNIFFVIYFLLLLNNETASYADHNTPQTIKKSASEKIRHKKVASKKTFYVVSKQQFES